MKIGIDIDGVLSDEEEFLYKNGTMFCNEMKLTNFAKPGMHYTKDIFGWDDETDYMFWQRYYMKYLTDTSSIRTGAGKYIKRLRHINHKIIIMTDRTNQSFNELKIDSDIKVITRKWLNDNNIEYDDLHFTERNKVKRINDIGIDIMIEDNSDILKRCSAKHKICFITNLYKRNTKHDFIEVNTWAEVYKSIENYSILSPTVS